jgi:hypothetical protein
MYPLSSTSLIIISGFALVIALWAFMIWHILKKEDAWDEQVIREGK